MPNRQLNTAACLIIGDEVLGGKTKDTNSHFFAKWCFDLGIHLKRIETISDDESEIIEAARRLSANYDFVVTSGGIGSTHDDITYPAIAKAFGLQLRQHEETLIRMKEVMKISNREPNFSWDVDSPARTARLRMTLLPFDPKVDEGSQALFVSENLWVPISVVNSNVHILPGIPRLFEALLEGIRPVLEPRLPTIHYARVLFSTPLPESQVADYLTKLAAKVEPQGVKVGSYPRWGKKRNTVTLTGKDKEYMLTLVPEIEAGIQGKMVAAEGEDDTPESSDRE